jgi:hypothetical protein
MFPQENIKGFADDSNFHPKSRNIKEALPQ